MAASEEHREHPVEPPLLVTPDGIEVHPHRVGHKKLDLVVAGSAILISCVSLYVAMQDGRTMRQLVAANSWPLLQFASSNTGENNKLTINLSVENVGVGPALVRRFRVLYGGKSYSNPYVLVHDCCAYQLSTFDPTKFAVGAPVSSRIEGVVLKSGERRDYFTLNLAKGDEQAWKKLDAARFRFQFEACYCSVLGTCWSSNLTGIDPKEIKQCPPADKPVR